MTDEQPENAGRDPRTGPALALLLAVVLLGPACQEDPTASRPPSPEPAGAMEARDTAEDDCRRFGRLFGLEGLAEEIGARSADPRDVATAYAARVEPGPGEAVFEGCLAGVRQVLAMEEEAAQIAPVAELAAERASCTAVRTTLDEGRAHIQEGDPPPEYGTTPATSGPHRPGILPPAVSVYHQPVDEPTAVHNLEHGYAFLYYREADPAVAPELVGMLEGLAREFDKVVVAPHPGLPEDAGLALVAWRRLQRCPPTIALSDAEIVGRSFVLRFAGTDVAPEPLGP